ncbi:hypothetical protein NX059_009648 [Plenodomus lindquistii]|nr:hypothetical protein NX059_009648 [Plenodomus lindquistii]
MSSNYEDSYMKPRSFSDSSVSAAKELETASPDLLTFLAVIQNLKTGILPITWQVARQHIGKGAIGKVNQALVNLHTSFAFKCVSDEKKRENKGAIMSALINEVVTLSHLSIQEHPNIVELQGICWDVTTDELQNHEVWPVLVFEKSQFGDLYDFARLPAGRDLSFAERLDLCFEVGTAISDMHSRNIIHGDIKPDNILIFRRRTGGYTAKVTDFGYSTRFLSEGATFLMSKSPTWCAPELVFGTKYSPSQARETDMYSFGMLCLWLLFEGYLSGETPLPEEARWIGQYLPKRRSLHPSIHVLGEVKDSNQLVLLARQLLRAEQDFDQDIKIMLERFFTKSLAFNPHDRDLSLQELLGADDLDW